MIIIITLNFFADRDSGKVAGVSISKKPEESPRVTGSREADQSSSNSTGMIEWSGERWDTGTSVCVA